METDENNKLLEALREFITRDRAVIVELENMLAIDEIKSDIEMLKNKLNL